MDCNHECENCPASTFLGDGKTNCMLLNKELKCIEAKTKAYTQIKKYYEEKMPQKMGPQNLLQ